ncbi:ABC transporter permease [Arthrobacter sp. LFS091]|uniref:ABC transporter permease n=1 Tax=Arthrobacter sp. LFS091 TaxID=3229892 RepID=UPI003A804A8F
MSAKKAVLPEPAAIQQTSVDMRKLSRVGSRPALLDYLVQLWEYRQFIFYDARARVQSGSRRDRLGSAWLLLNPVFNGLTYYIIFGLLLQTSHGVPNFVGYLVVGIFMAQFSTGGITAVARSVRSGRSVIQAFNFPRAALPIGANVRELLAAVPLFIAMFMLVILLPPVEQITWLWLLVLPAIALMWLFNLGVGMMLARLISKIHDVTHLLPFAIRAWMYASAIFYSYERFVKAPEILEILKLNPLFNVIDIVRNCLLYNQPPSLHSWLSLALFCIAALVLGFFVFWRGEEKYARD